MLMVLIIIIISVGLQLIVITVYIQHMFNGERIKLSKYMYLQDTCYKVMFVCYRGRAVIWMLMQNNKKCQTFLYSCSIFIEMA